MSPHRKFCTSHTERFVFQPLLLALDLRKFDIIPEKSSSSARSITKTSWTRQRSRASSSTGAFVHKTRPKKPSSPRSTKSHSALLRRSRAKDQKRDNSGDDTFFPPPCKTVFRRNKTFLRRLLDPLGRKLSVVHSQIVSCWRFWYLF